MRDTTRLRIRVFVLAGAGALVVAVGIALLLGNTVSQRGRAARDQRLSRDLVRVIALERLAVDAETGLRGYVITGRTGFLAPTRRAQAALPAAVASLRSAVREDRVAMARSGPLITAVEQYFNRYLPAVLPLVTRRPAIARSVSVTALGKTEVDRIRTLTAGLEHDLTMESDASAQAARGGADDAVAEAIAVLVALTVLTLGLGGYLGRLAVQRDEARRRSEATSRTLQRSILPESVPEVPGVELAVRFEPAGAGQLVGGDFYDVFAQRPGVWSIILGDVCGKGADAAAVSAMARWTLRSLAGSEIGPGAALRFLNDAMLRQSLSSRFITLAQLELAIEPKRARVRVACAGHPAPILVSAAGGAEEIDAGGDLLGIWSSIRLRPAELILEPGDGIVLYTDGITDFGPDAAEAPIDVLRPLADAGAPELADAVAGIAPRHPSPRRDDVAVIALRFRGVPASVEARPAAPAATADR